MPTGVGPGGLPIFERQWIFPLVANLHVERNAQPQPKTLEE
jgi:hypothetical protein